MQIVQRMIIGLLAKLQPVKQEWLIGWYGRQIRQVQAASRDAGPGAIPLFCVLRNERHQLPTFLEHYRRLGVSRFVMVDNGSTDGSLDYLRGQPDVALYSSRLSLIPLKIGLNRWIRKLGRGKWCLMVDADERFVYPHCETSPLPVLTQWLDEEGATAVRSKWLDMYADAVINDAIVRESPAIEKQFPFFDPDELTVSATQRVLGWKRFQQKFPLFRAGPKVFVANGTHQVRPVTESSVQGLMLHFSFHAKTFGRAVEAVAMQQYVKKSIKYRHFVKTMAGGQVNFYQDGSCRYEDSQQMIRMGFVTTSPSWDERCQ